MLNASPYQAAFSRSVAAERWSATTSVVEAAHVYAEAPDTVTCAASGRSVGARPIEQLAALCVTVNV